jgi:hypothetical protein
VNLLSKDSRIGMYRPKPQLKISKNLHVITRKKNKFRGNENLAQESVAFTTVIARTEWI